MNDGDYELLDFGCGRRLERLGPVVLDRPCPAAEPFAQKSPQRWHEAAARFEGRADEKGTWTDRCELPSRWSIAFGQSRFELKRTDFGHLGVFPEQADNWRWIARALSPRPLKETQRVGADHEQQNTNKGRVPTGDVPPSAFPSSPSSSVPLPTLPRPLAHEARGLRPKILNLFAYTGGSTLAAAAAGAEVVHLDAAKNVVAWARRNAELSGLADAPIRWIAEDALKFVRRELRRGNRYDGLILDPPSYGHGAHGEVWRLAKHLPQLLAYSRELVGDNPALLLLTCHTPGYNADVLRAMLAEHFSVPTHAIEARPLTLRAVDGRELPSGVLARYARS